MSKEFVRLSMEDIGDLVPMSYQKGARFILKGYPDDFTNDELGCGQGLQHQEVFK